MKKSDNLANWRAMRGERVNPLPIMRALPYKAAGSTYGADGVRIDGSPAFIDAVLSCLVDLLPGESDATRLDFARRDVKPIAGKTWENSAAGAQVCYIRLRERGPVARILRGAGYVPESAEKSNGAGPVVVEPPALPFGLELGGLDDDELDSIFDDEELAEFSAPALPVYESEPEPVLSDEENAAREKWERAQVAAAAKIDAGDKEFFKAELKARGVDIVDYCHEQGWPLWASDDVAKRAGYHATTWDDGRNVTRREKLATRKVKRGAQAARLQTATKRAR